MTCHAATSSGWLVSTSASQCRPSGTAGREFRGRSHPDRANTPAHLVVLGEVEVDQRDGHGLGQVHAARVAVPLSEGRGCVRGPACPARHRAGAVPRLGGDVALGDGHDVAAGGVGRLGAHQLARRQGVWRGHPDGVVFHLSGQIEDRRFQPGAADVD